MYATNKFYKMFIWFKYKNIMQWPRWWRGPVSNAEWPFYRGTGLAAPAVFATLSTLRRLLYAPDYYNIVYQVDSERGPILTWVRSNDAPSLRCSSIRGEKITLKRNGSIRYVLVLLLFTASRQRLTRTQMSSVEYKHP